MPDNAPRKSWLCRIGLHDWIYWLTDPRYGWCQRCPKEHMPGWSKERDRFDD